MHGLYFSTRARRAAGIPPVPRAHSRHLGCSSSGMASKAAPAPQPERNNLAGVLQSVGRHDAELMHLHQMYSTLQNNTQIQAQQTTQQLGQLQSQLQQLQTQYQQLQHTVSQMQSQQQQIQQTVGQMQSQHQQLQQTVGALQSNVQSLQMRPQYVPHTAAPLPLQPFIDTAKAEAALANRPMSARPPPPAKPPQTPPQCETKAAAKPIAKAGATVTAKDSAVVKTEQAVAKTWPKSGPKSSGSKSSGPKSSQAPPSVPHRSKRGGAAEKRKFECLGRKFVLRLCFAWVL